MMRVVFALIGLLFAGAAFAQTADPCQVADGVLQPGFPLPHVTAAIEHKQLDIVVLGTMSSALVGAGGNGKAYPARFEAMLKEKLPDVAVRVVSYAKPRQTAQDMQKEIAPILSRDKPALIVWQTGTGDAIRAIDPDAFSTALDEGASGRAGGRIRHHFDEYAVQPPHRDDDRADGVSRRHAICRAAA